MEVRANKKHIIYVIFKDGEPCTAHYIKAAYPTYEGANIAISHAVRREMKDIPLFIDTRRLVIVNLHNRYSIKPVVVA